MGTGRCRRSLRRGLILRKRPAADARSSGICLINRIDDYQVHRWGQFGVRDSRGHVQVLQAVLLGILPLEQPGGRGPPRRSRDFDDLLERHFLVVPVACRPSRLPRLNGRLLGRVLNRFEVVGAIIGFGLF